MESASDMTEISSVYTWLCQRIDMRTLCSIGVVKMVNKVVGLLDFKQSLWNSSAGFNQYLHARQWIRLAWVFVFIWQSLCDDNDMKEMGLPLGPRKKLQSYLREYKEKQVSDSLPFRIWFKLFTRLNNQWLSSAENWSLRNILKHEIWQNITEIACLTLIGCNIIRASKKYWNLSNARIIQISNWISNWLLCIIVIRALLSR